MPFSKKILYGAVLGLGMVFSVFLISGALGRPIAGLALAQNDTDEPDITFPVAELGNCKNEAECRAYCNRPKNMKACLDFAEEHGLIPEEELAMARQFAALGGQGPGGCNSKESCEAYCEDVSHINECIAFAEENDFLPPEELEEAKKVQEALASGAALPGGCRSKRECDSYCEDPAHMEECIAFGEAAGFIPEDELEEAKLVLEAVRKGARPPPCRGKKACDDYCSQPENLEQCLTFAEAAGFISPEEAEMARKTGGQGPGGCRGREECDEFCEDENNFPMCLEFAEKYGLISPEDAEMARKTGGKGPGNCKGKEECEQFCQNPANQETCFNFAKEHGLISEEDLERMEEGKEQILEAFSNAPPEVVECLNSALGSDFIEKIKSGEAMPSPAIGDTMRQCFEQAMGGMGPPGFGPGGPGGGPGMSTSVNISVKGGQLGLEVMMRVPGGIRDFSIQPEGESSYGGGVPGCPREFKAETRFTADSFPLAVAITDCNDNKHDFSVTAEGNYKQEGEEGGEGAGGFPPGMMPPGFEGGGSGPGFSGPGGCRSQKECGAYCRANPEECKGFGPPSGGGEPGRPPEEQICLQVLTPARDPQTGKCVIFGNSCIPPGWIPVRGETEGCEEQGLMPPYEGAMPKPPTAEEMQKIIEQQTQQQFQQQMQQQTPSLMPPGGFIAPPPPGETLPLQPSSQNPLQHLLGTMLAPFANLLNR